MALVGGGPDPPGGGHLFAPPEFLEPAGELEAALGGLTFGGGAGAGVAGADRGAAPPPPSSSAVPIAIPGGPGGLRRPAPGGLGGVPGDDLAAFIPVAPDGADPPPLPSPSTSEQLSAAFAARCEVGPGGGGPPGPLGVPTGASASAGAPPLLAGIDEEDDLDLVFGEDDDDLLRALDSSGPGAGPPPPGGSALWAEYGASAPAAGMADYFFPGGTPHHHPAAGAHHGGPATLGAAGPARHPSTAGFSIAAVSPAALHGGSTEAGGGGVPAPAAGGLTRSFAAAGGHGGFAAGSAASDADAWPGAASLPSHLTGGRGAASVLSPAHARAGGGGGGVGAYFPRAPSAPHLWPGGHHPPAIRGFAVGTPPVGSAPGTSGFLVGSLGAGGAGGLASALSGSVGRSTSRGGEGRGSGGSGRPLSATSPALKHSSSHGSSLARAAIAAAAAGAGGAGAPASRAGRVSRPPRRPLDDDDGSFESGSYGAAPGSSFGAGGSASGGRGAGGGRKHHNPWSVEETEALVAGVEACGGGKWADIKKLGWATIDGRSAVDLKDKWRNLTRLVSLPSALPRAVARSAAEPGGEKRRLPPELLERVRALMPADPDLPYGRITASRAPGARSRARGRR